jgi:hypothetical protein
MDTRKGSILLSSVRVTSRAAFPNVQDNLKTPAKTSSRDVFAGTLSLPSNAPPIAADVLSFVSLQVLQPYLQSLSVTTRASEGPQLGLQTHMLDFIGSLAQCCPMQGTLGALHAE